MKKIVLFLMLLITPACFSLTKDSIEFKMSSDDVFIMSLGILSKLNYKIDEIQSKSGYILFKTRENHEYLLMVSENGENSSFVKILKTKQSYPLKEVQQIVFTALGENMQDVIKKADE